MPGPGGGSRGSGGSRGGFGGGSRGSFGGGSRGSFGGGSRGGFGGHHYHGPHYHGGWHHYYGPRRYYGGGGCLGGMLSMLIAPIVMIMFAVILIFSAFVSALGTVSIGGVSMYDENALQDYADSQYAAEFGSTSDYEDNILLVFLVEDDEYYDYHFIAWVGDHIDYEINEMFGSNQSKLGYAIERSAINSNSYKYSLDSGVAAVVNTMKGHVLALDLPSSFNCDSESTTYKSHLTNNTSLDLTESTVNDALTSFTAATGIPVVVVVEDIEEVFPKEISSTDIVFIIVGIIIIIIAIANIAKAVKSRKKATEDDGSYKGNNTANDDFNNGF